MLRFFQAHAYLSKYYERVGLVMPPMPDKPTEETLRDRLGVCMAHEGVDAESAGGVFEAWMRLAPMVNLAENGAMFAKRDVNELPQYATQYDGPRPPLLEDAINRWVSVSPMRIIEGSQ